MNKSYPTRSVSNISKEIKTFALVISVIIHLIAVFYPYEKHEEQSLTVRNVGIINGAKNAQIMILRKSELQGQDIGLKPQNNSGGKPQKASLSKIAITSQNNKNESVPKTPAKMIVQKIEGKDVKVPQELQFSQQSRAAFDGSMFDLNIILPEGIKEDQLNRFEEMFYSFRKRVAEQYINQILLLSITTGNRYPRSSFPWTNKTQTLRAKLTFDISGNIQRIEHLQKADSKILQEYFQDVMHSLNQIPNPPKAILNQEQSFELIFGLNIVN